MKILNESKTLENVKIGDKVNCKIRMKSKYGYGLIPKTGIVNSVGKSSLSVTVDGVCHTVYGQNVSHIKSE